MALQVYTYQKCSTCRKATEWLDDHGIAYREIPIRETPPNVRELKRMLKHYDGNLRRIFNTSGMDYRALGIKDKLDGMSDEEAFELLRSNGMLVKRPFATGDSGMAAGFREAEWEQQFS